MKKSNKQGAIVGGLVAMVIAFVVVFTSRGGKTIPKIPIRQNGNDTSGIVIGSPVGLMPKVIRGVCLTKGCLLGTVVGSDPSSTSDTSSTPTTESKFVVSYSTPVDVPAGTVIHLEIQLSPANADR